MQPNPNSLPLDKGAILRPFAAYCGRFKILGTLDRKRRNSAVCSCREKRGDGAREDEQF